jgi:hypothetical protein
MQRLAGVCLHGVAHGTRGFGQLEDLIVRASFELDLLALAAAKRHADALKPHHDRVVPARHGLDCDAAAVAIHPAANPFSRGAVAAGIEGAGAVLDLRRQGEVVAEILLLGVAILFSHKRGLVLTERDVAKEQDELGDLLLGVLAQVQGVMAAGEAKRGVRARRQQRLELDVVGAVPPAKTCSARREQQPRARAAIQRFTPFSSSRLTEP